VENGDDSTFVPHPPSAVKQAIPFNLAKKRERLAGRKPVSQIDFVALD